MYGSGFKVLPQPKGPFSTGCHDLMIGKSKSGVLMRLFYPTSKFPSSEQLTPWYIGQEYIAGLSRIYSPSMPLAFQTLFNWSTETLRIFSKWNSPVAEGRFPVVVFSHGFSGHRGLYSTICNDLASHGFFVAAVEHRDESACATFTVSGGGQKIWLPQKLLAKGEKEYPLRKQQIEIRAAECSRALDALHDLNDGLITKNDLSEVNQVKAPTPASRCDDNNYEDAAGSWAPLSPGTFAGRLDLSNPVISGHSFGGSTAMLALHKDKRFKLGVALDSWMLPLKEDVTEVSQSLDRPLLVVLTDGFRTQANMKSLAPFDNQSATSPSVIVTLKGSVHQNQSDTPYLFNSVGSYLAGCWSDLDKMVATDLNNRLMMNFMFKYIGYKNTLKPYNISAAKKYLLMGVGLRPASVQECSELLGKDVSDEGIEPVPNAENCDFHNSKL